MFSDGIRKPPASITPASTAAWRCWLGRTPSRPAGSSNVPLTRPPQTHPPLPPATLHKGRSAGRRPQTVSPWPTGGLAYRRLRGMTTARTDKFLAILQKSFNPREEGWLWLATYLDGREGGVVSQFEGAYEDVARTAAGLGHIIGGCGADRTYLALCRREGRPNEA